MIETASIPLTYGIFARSNSVEMNLLCHYNAKLHLDVWKAMIEV